MITGAPPFQADSAVSVMLKHVTQPLPDIRQLNQNVPDLLVAVTKKALAKDPGERYRTASDMAVALRTIDIVGAGRGHHARQISARLQSHACRLSRSHSKGCF